MQVYIASFPADIETRGSEGVHLSAQIQTVFQIVECVL